MKQPAQFQKLFQEIVSLCNQFSFYIDSFTDIDIGSLRQDSQGDLLQLNQLLQGVERFQDLSEKLMNQYISIAQCSEIQHTVRFVIIRNVQVLYSADVSVEMLLVVICIICVIVFLAAKFIFW